MTHRERILAAIRGEVPDRLPWVPRLEFWHRARLRQGTLPPELRSLTLTEITERLGVGCYASIPDFTDVADETAMIDRTLGLFHLPVLPYRVTLEDVDRRVTRHGQETVVEYHTPAGSIRTASVFTEEMLDAGASMSWITEHAIREPRDFDVVGHIFSHLRIEPHFEGYLARRQEVGEQGLAIGYLLGTAWPDPAHHEGTHAARSSSFMPSMTTRKKFTGWRTRSSPFSSESKQIGADSPAEVLLLGGNYDDSITHPPFFEKYIFPALRDYAEVLHRPGQIPDDPHRRREPAALPPVPARRIRYR